MPLNARPTVDYSPEVVLCPVVLFGRRAIEKAARALGPALKAHDLDLSVPSHGISVQHHSWERMNSQFGCSLLRQWVNEALMTPVSTSPNTAPVSGLVRNTFHLLIDFFPGGEV